MNTTRVLMILGALGLLTVVLGIGLLGGYLFGRTTGPWRGGAEVAPYCDECPGAGRGPGWGSGRGWQWTPPEGDTGAAPGTGGEAESLEEVEAAFEAYLARRGYDDLYLTEVMEFERNYYAIVAEQDTEIGAMELLLDKRSGAITLEPGPNMMWNARYGMHRGGMMGPRRSTEEMRLSPEDAEGVAQRWLDENLPGRGAGEADPFYGYYTLHFTRDGQVEGMLSVHGATGQVWYHNWHGDFIRMTEHEEHS